MPLSGARVLVTGASGLLGGQVLGRLAGGECEVFAVSRSARPDELTVRWLASDLSEPRAMTELVEFVRPDIVVHLAGEVRGARDLDAVSPTLSTNLIATVELLEAATRLGCRRIVLSGSLLEEPAGGGPQAVPPSPYGASRWAASAYARMFWSLFQTPVVILRPSFAYGPGQESTKLVPHVIGALLEGRDPELSSGDRLLDFVYAEDVARAYVAAAAAPGLEGRTIDIGSGVLTSVREAVDLIVAAVGPSDGAPAFGSLAVRPHEQQIEVDTDDAARAFGWRATTDLKRGLEATVAWHRARTLVAAAPG